MGLDAGDDKSLDRPAHLPDLPVPRRLRLRGHGRRREHRRRPAAPQRRRPLRPDPRAAPPGARPRRVPPPARGVGAPARRAARRRRPRPRPGAHRHPAREPRRRAARARRPALRAHPLPRLGAGGGQGGSPRAVRRARLADHADRRPRRSGSPPRRSASPSSPRCSPLRASGRSGSTPGSPPGSSSPSPPRPPGRRSPSASPTCATRRCACTTPTCSPCPSAPGCASSTGTHPSAEDWVRLLGDWLLNHVAESDDPADAEVLAVVRAALPSVGYQWTRRGVRRGRSTVDRVLARSYAKPGAAAQIIAAEHAAIGVRARVLVLCDHERASATVPVDLAGVLDAEAGSALAALETLLTDPDTAVLHPMLVTGSVVAASEETLRDLVAFVAARDPELACPAARRDRATVRSRRARPGGPRAPGSPTSRRTSRPAAPRSSSAPAACSARGGTPAASPRSST